MPSRIASSLTLSFLLLLLPLAIWTQREMPNQWSARLIYPDFLQEPSRHTPIHPIGMFLPKEITSDTTLTSDQNPVILTGQTQIKSGATLTVSPGTKIFAHEFSGITVAGRLIVNGSLDKPSIFTTNELHPDNQIWNGITFIDNGQGNINYTHFNFASPAITCLPNTNVALDHLKIRDTITGIFTQSNKCAISNSSVVARRTGLVSTISQPNHTSSHISGKQSDVSVFEN